MKLNSDLGLYNHPLTLTISGLSSFNGRVVFAEVSDQTRLLKVSGDCVMVKLRHATFKGLHKYILLHDIVQVSMEPPEKPHIL